MEGAAVDEEVLKLVRDHQAEEENPSTSILYQGRSKEIVVSHEKDDDLDSLNDRDGEIVDKMEMNSEQQSDGLDEMIPSSQRDKYGQDGLNTMLACESST